MHIDWWTLALQTINALVLIWLLGRFLFRPVAKMVDERRLAAARIMEQADAARGEAVKARDDAVAQAADLAAQRGHALDAIHDEATTLRGTLEQDARADADRIRATASADVEATRRAQILAGERQACLLAIDIAGKLLDRLPAASRIDGFVEGLTAEIGRLPPATLSGLGAAGDSCRLLTPRALSNDEVLAIHDALKRVLGRDLPLDIVVEPALIAGLELDTPHAAVRNSWRADLDHLKTDLLSDDTRPDA